MHAHTRPRPPSPHFHVPTALCPGVTPCCQPAVPLAIPWRSPEGRAASARPATPRPGGHPGGRHPGDRCAQPEPTH
eukprot:7378761-Prymnesium_polylepis.1